MNIQNSAQKFENISRNATGKYKFFIAFRFSLFTIAKTKVSFFS